MIINSLSHAHARATNKTNQYIFFLELIIIEQYYYDSIYKLYTTFL